MGMLKLSKLSLKILVQVLKWKQRTAWMPSWSPRDSAILTLWNTLKKTSPTLFSLTKLTKQEELRWCWRKSLSINVSENIWYEWSIGRGNVKVVEGRRWHRNLGSKEMEVNTFTIWPLPTPCIHKPNNGCCNQFSLKMSITYMKLIMTIQCSFVSMIGKMTVCVFVNQ